MEGKKEMTKEEMEKADRISRWCANQHWHKMGLVSAEPEDLRQEAWVGLLEAMKREDAEREDSKWAFRSASMSGHVKNHVNRDCQVVRRVMQGEKPVLLDATDTARLDGLWSKMSRAQKAQMAEKGGSLMTMPEAMELDRRQLMEMLTEVLDERELEVVVRRWWFEETYEVVAKAMGMSHKMVVLKMERKALEKMRGWAEEKGIVEDLLHEAGIDEASGMDEVDLFGDNDAGSF